MQLGCMGMRHAERLGCCHVGADLHVSAPFRPAGRSTSCFYLYGALYIYIALERMPGRSYYCS